MPDRTLAQLLQSLLPGRMGRDAFEPASEDLRAERLRRRGAGRSTVATRARDAWYAAAVFVLFIDCWRLVLFGALGRRPTPPRIPDPRPKKSYAMLIYLVRHALRRLVREPAFTIAAVLTLALGVGANVAVFAVVEAVLLRPLPYPDAERLILLNHRDQHSGITKEYIAIGDFVDIVARQSTFEAVAGYGNYQATVYDLGDPFRVDALSASPELLGLLGARPALGRTLRPDDSRPGAAPVMMIGHQIWESRFGADRRIIGRTIKIGGTPREVVGVAPPGFAFPPSSRVEVIVPMDVPVVAPSARKSDWTLAVARLKPDRTLEGAATNLATISRQLARELPASNQASEYFAVPIRTALLGNTRPALVLLASAVAVVLLIACANVANLLLARSLGRRREMALRMALGAGRGRLIMQLLVESLVLSIVAGVGGVLIAQWGSHALVALLPQSSTVPGLDAVRIDGPVLGFTLGVTIATSLAFGLIAALTVGADNAAGVLGAPSRSTMGTGARRATSGLVVVEVALAVVLLIGAGLILRSFAGLLAVDPGFRTDGVMTIGIQLPADRYREVGPREEFYSRAFAALRAQRDVQEVGAAVVIPLTGNNWTVPFERPERPVPSGERPPEVGWQVASGGYFRALRIPLVAGRLFDERDRPDGPPVVIISEAVQRRFFPGTSAVGHQVKTGDGRAEIVGVVGDIRRAGLRDEPRADMYFPVESNPGGAITLFVRTSSAPAQSVASVQSAIRRIEPNVLFLETRSLADVASESVRVTQIVFWLLGLFAATALVLAAVGIYGVMSYVVRQRTREIGTRLALGATRGNILWLVLRQGALIAAAGTGVGLATGLATTRLLQSMLFGVSAWDPASLAAAVVVLVSTILLACYLPARRAASLDPARTLSDS